jgi:type I restriction enzyme S subunit
MSQVFTTLGEIGEWGSGGTPLSSKPEFYNGPIPWLIIEDLNDGIVTKSKNFITEIGLKNSSAKLINPNTLLIAMYGASIGKLGVSGIRCATNQAIAFCKINPEIVDIWYVFYYLLSCRSKFLSEGRGNAQQNISQSFLKDYPIYPPPLQEQQRIAAILQKADRLRRLRRYARQLSDGYLQSVFLEMFGDPATNPKGFPKDLLGNVVRINPGIDRQIALNSKISFVPMMGVNEQTGKIIFSEERTFREVSKGYTPFIENDVLFAKITPCMENGKSAIASHLINGIGFGSTEFHVLRPTKLTTSEWIFWLIRKKEFRQLASKSFTGTAGQQRVPTSFLENFPVPIPPVALQNQFVEICKGYDQLLKRFIESERQTETLFQSLLQQAFQGEL